MKKLLLFIFSLFLWFFFTGQFSLPVLVLGIAISLICAFLFGELVFRFSRPTVSPKAIIKKIFYAILVLVTFLYDAYVSALKVSFHSFEINPSFSPGIVKIKTDLTKLTAVTIQANLITLTPGTLVVDYDVIDDFYYIHWIDIKTKEEADIKKQVIGRHEKWVAQILDSGKKAGEK